MARTKGQIILLFLLVSFVWVSQGYAQNARLDLKLSGGGWSNATLYLHLNVAMDQNTTGNMEVTGYGYDLAGTYSPIMFTGRALLWSNEYVYLWLKGQRTQKVDSEDPAKRTFFFIYYNVEIRLYAPSVYDPIQNTYMSILSDSSGMETKKTGPVEIM